MKTYLYSTPLPARDWRRFFQAMGGRVDTHPDPSGERSSIATPIMTGDANPGLGIETMPVIVETDSLRLSLAAERERVARLVEEFEWILPSLEDAKIIRATDDAAAIVRAQIAAAIRAMT